MYWIGIDTGRHTGLAVWNDADDRFEAIVELPLYKALRFVEQWKDSKSRVGRKIFKVQRKDRCGEKATDRRQDG